MTKIQWEKVSSRVRTIFNFGVEKSEWLENCRMARLIAAVPFIAGCNRAEETSFTHLAVYVMSIDGSTKELYFHKAEDDENPFSRLLPISNFSSGNQQIIKCCMDLILLSMISNYNKDAQEDMNIGKYNPIASGKWNYSELSKSVIKRIDENITPEISAVYTTEKALKGVWND